jgi:hypothetical protein
MSIQELLPPKLPYFFGRRFMLSGLPQILVPEIQATTLSVSAASLCLPIFRHSSG